MDFDAYLQSKGYSVGTRIPRTTANQLHAAWLKEGGGQQFQPQTGSATNAATGDVVRYFTSSPNSAQVLPEDRFKEGPIDKNGVQLVFDPAKGDYFPATNRATKAPVQPKVRSSGFVMGPNGQLMPAGMAEMEDPTATPAPTPDPGMTNSMAFAGVPTRGAYETNMATGVAAPVLSPDAMGGGGGISMTPVARATAAPAPAATNAPVAAPGPMTPDQVRAAYRQGAISKEQARALLQGGL